MMHTEQLNELAAALAKAQGAMQNAKKDANNPFFKSKYADLASVWDAVRGPLSSNDLSVIQSIDCDEHGMVLITKLLHSSGQWVDSKVMVKAVKEDPQGLGSAITYMRRYALQAIAGVSPDEDDGEAAMGRDEEGDKKQKAKPAPAKPAPTKPVPASPAPTNSRDARVTAKQVDRFWSIVTASGYTNDQGKEILVACGYQSSRDILMRHYDTICKCIEETPVDQYKRAMDELSKWCKEN